jgi:hypothetical protein
MKLPSRIAENDREPLPRFDERIEILDRGADLAIARSLCPYASHETV